MIAYKKALGLLRAAADKKGVLPAETVGLERCSGRVLARKVLSAEALPSFDNSAMDGYAVRTADIANAPAALAVT